MRASSKAGGGRFVEARWAIGEDTTAVAPRDAVGSSAPPPNRLGVSEQAQSLRDAQATAGASTAAAARALKMAQEAREVACATISELGSQSEALKSAAASLGEAEAAVDASERTLDDINAGCFGCFAPSRRLARHPLAPGGGGRRWWSRGGASAGAASATAAAQRQTEAPAPAETGGGPRAASQRPRKAASAKTAAARARLASSQPPHAVAGGSAGGGAAVARPGGGSAFGDALLDREASAQDATLSQLDAAVSELAVISSRIGEELDQQAPVLEALHQRADELGGRFRAMNTTGKMGRIKAGPASGNGTPDASSAHSRKASR